MSGGDTPLRAVLELGGWSAGERGALERLDASLCDGSAPVRAARGLSADGEPWLAVTSAADGEALVRVARVAGRIDVRTLAEGVMREGGDLKAVLRRAADADPDGAPAEPGAAVPAEASPAALSVLLLAGFMVASREAGGFAAGLGDVRDDRGGGAALAEAASAAAGGLAHTAALRAHRGEHPSGEAGLGAPGTRAGTRHLERHEAFAAALAFALPALGAFDERAKSRAASGDATGTGPDPAGPLAEGDRLEGVPPRAGDDGLAGRGDRGPASGGGGTGGDAARGRLAATPPAERGAEPAAPHPAPSAAAPETATAAATPPPGPVDAGPAATAAGPAPLGGELAWAEAGPVAGDVIPHATPAAGAAPPAATPGGGEAPAAPVGASPPGRDAPEPEGGPAPAASPAHAAAPSPADRIEAPGAPAAGAPLEGPATTVATAASGRDEPALTGPPDPPPPPPPDPDLELRPSAVPGPTPGPRPAPGPEPLPPPGPEPGVDPPTGPGTGPSVRPIPAARTEPASGPDPEPAPLDGTDPARAAEPEPEPLPEPGWGDDGPPSAEPALAFEPDVAPAPPPGAGDRHPTPDGSGLSDWV